MTRFVAFLCVLALCPAAAGAAMNKSPDAALAGRTAGKPIECLSHLQSDWDTRLFADGSLLYKGVGTTLFLNRPGNCPRFEPGSIIVEKSFSGQVCRGDIIRLLQPGSRIEYGSCALGQFVPYPKAR